MMRSGTPRAGRDRIEPPLEFGIALSAVPGFVSLTHIPCGRWVHNVSVLNIAAFIGGHHCDSGSGSW